MKAITTFKKVFFITLFLSSSACGSGEANNQTVPPDTSVNYNLTIEFSGPAPLGTVSILPINEACKKNCTVDILADTTVELIAEPDENPIFTGWSGACQGMTKCQLTMNQNKNVTANFEVLPTTYVLSLQIDNGGLVKIDDQILDCTPDCQRSYTEGDTIELKALANDGFVFNGWSDGCRGTSSCSITMNGSKSLHATFSTVPFNKKSNTILITEPHGKKQIDYPVQFGRSFVEDDIQNFPQVMIDGIKINTQADVKQRYHNGSVKHAIISFILAELPANSSKTVNFVNTTQNNNEPLTKQQMLSTDYFFDATMKFYFPEEKTVLARQMLENNDFEYWLTGPIATTIIIKDHSIDRLYDIGADEHRSIRPIFHVTFWPGIKKYSVRYIAEAMNTEALQDQSYHLSLYIDFNDNPFYQQENVPHQAMTRWTKKVWSGEQLQTLSINHNIDYLIKSKSLPNFDTTKVISEQIVTNDWNIWQTKYKDIYQKGWWQPAMGVGGGRPDIGIYPTWTIKWLYTGDWRHQEIALKQSELASAWPIHLREGRAGLKFDMNGTVEALGKIISMAPLARPTHWTARPDWYEVKTEDKINPLFPLIKTNWVADKAHHPELASPQYLLTGDYFYLEQMLFSAAFVSGDNNAVGYSSTLGRGPTGSEGGLYSGEVRGQAWAFRTRVHTYDILPDSSPEKSYFHLLNQNAISMWEGLMNLPLSNTLHSDLHSFVKKDLVKNGFKTARMPSKIGQWDEGTHSPSYVHPDRVNTDNVNRALAPWMQNFVIIALGRAKELGYNTDSLLIFAGSQLLEPFSDPSLPHAMICAYIVPTLDQNNEWFTTWHDIYSQYTSEYINEVENFIRTNNDPEHGYHSITMAAAAYLEGFKNHHELWQYVKQNIAIKTIYDDNPKWAILPRKQDNE